MIRGFGLFQDIDGQEWQEVVFANSETEASQKLADATPYGYTMVYESFRVVDEPSDCDYVLMCLNEIDRN